MKSILHSWRYSVFICAFLFSTSVWAQTHIENDGNQTTEVSQAEQAIAVEAIKPDKAISERIERILQATQWYQELKVSVSDGIVFIDGITKNEEQRDWARSLALRTEGVVAVVNRLQIHALPDWSPTPAIRELRSLFYSFISNLPLIFLALVILPLAWLCAKLIYRRTHYFTQKQFESPLLADIIAKAIAFPCFLLGLYLVLQVAGLTHIALSMLGGAGVVGIVVGFAFRDIAENFLASLLLSIRRPFVSGDVVSIDGHRGIVQSMNTRSTIVLSGEGVHIQVPNAKVFKSVIHNYTTSPNLRAIITLAISYKADIDKAQETLLTVLQEHEAILDEPKPLVLVDSIEKSVIYLKIYFWFDAVRYAETRVRSSILRLCKHALEAAEIALPDGTYDVKLYRVDDATNLSNMVKLADKTAAHHGPASIQQHVTLAEGDLSNETEEIKSQSCQNIAIDQAQDLLTSSETSEKS